MIRVLTGLEDARLLDHLTTLEQMESGPGAGLSGGEHRLRQAILDRLDLITTPEQS